MKIQVVIDEEKISRRLDEMACEINEKYKGAPLKLIGILKGSVFLMTELSKRLTMDVTMDFMQVSSYGKGQVSSGRIKIVKELGAPITGENVLIVEDIIDSGCTMSQLMPMLWQEQPASLELCTLLSKPSRRTAEVVIDYCGFEIEDYFVVGYGMDVNEKYRNLPYIGRVTEE